MKKILLGFTAILALMAFTNFAIASVNTDNTYTQTQSEDEKCASGKCGEGKCASGKCGGGK